VPIYDYICGACGQRTEVVHGVHVPGPERCEHCGGGPLRKAMVAPAVHFKGTGWAKKERASSGVKPARDPDLPTGEKSGSDGSSSDASAPAASGDGASGGDGNGGKSGNSGASGQAGTVSDGSGGTSRPSSSSSAEA
jgi:putative FmdB family regulatory protein